MGAVIGDLLPLGLSVAISPIPIAAVILMLLSGQAARTSTGFLAGWVAGIVVVTVVVLLLVGQAGNTSAGKPSTASSVLKLVFGVLALGEGWHNNHHAQPQSARHGFVWYELDVNWYGIWMLRNLGLAWDVKLPKLGEESASNRLAA